MLGVIIGVASVITVVAIGEGIKEQVNRQIHSYDKNLITVRPAQLQAATATGNQALNLISGLNVTTPLTAKDVAAVAKAKGVSASAPLAIATGDAKSEQGTYSDGFVIGTSPALPNLINQSLAYGGFLSEDDMGGNYAVLGEHAADRLFDTDVPLGYSFTFRGETFLVRGIFNKFTTTPLSQQADFNNAIFIPYDVAQRLTKNNAPTYAILARPDAAAQSQQTIAAVRSSLTQTHGGSGDFEVLSGNQNLTSSETILDLLTRLIAGAAAISLLVGGIGIMNVMLVSVAERMHEIGIRKAVGATNRQILSQFLIESSLLTLAGGIIGIMVSGLIIVGLRVTTNLQPILDWHIVLIATGVSLIVGIVFGTVPAIKAARKDPIEALRAE